MRYDAQFFTPSEFACRCCGVGRPAALLALWLDLLRRAWGGPVRVNSGFRCAHHNAEVGGAKGSRHLIGCAADIAPVGVDGAELARFLGLAQRFCALPGWEVRVYGTFIHVAVPRDQAARPWNGETIALEAV